MYDQWEAQVPDDCLSAWGFTVRFRLMKSAATPRDRHDITRAIGRKQLRQLGRDAPSRVLLRGYDDPDLA